MCTQGENYINKLPILYCMLAGKHLEVALPSPPWDTDKLNLIITLWSMTSSGYSHFGVIWARWMERSLFLRLSKRSSKRNIMFLIKWTTSNVATIHQPGFTTPEFPEDINSAAALRINVKSINESTLPFPNTWYIPVARKPNLLPKLSVCTII